MKAYDKDLAYIHDVGFGHFAEKASSGLLAMLYQHGLTDGLIVDLGCGSGIWARALADAGFGVLGIDLSAAMIDLARERVPEGTFEVGSFLDIDLPPCAAVTALGEIFNYLFDERNTPDPLRRVFHHVYEALPSNGLFIFDFAEPGRGKGPGQKHFQGEDWAILTEYEEDPVRHQLIRRITSFRAVDGCYRRDHEIHTLRLYKGTDIARMLRRIGFRVRPVRGYGAHRFPNAYVGMIARKT